MKSGSEFSKFEAFLKSMGVHMWVDMPGRSIYVSGCLFNFDTDGKFVSTENDETGGTHERLPEVQSP